MTRSSNVSNRICLLLFVGFLCLSGCAGARPAVERAPSQSVPFSIAVFPVENLSGTSAPLKTVRESLIHQLKLQGFTVLDDQTLEGFMGKHRVRYTAGIDATTAQALGQETAAEGVLITSLELYSDAVPPKAALTSRLVSTGVDPRILWTDGVGLAGDDSPGILELGLIENPNRLLTKALGTLAASLGAHFQKQGMETAGRVDRRFQPKLSFRSAALDLGKKRTVAVIPFFNYSERRQAGEVMVLHFIRELQKSGNFDVVEPGLVRQAFLSLRVIMEEGVTLADVKALSAALNVDLLLTGKVFDYQDYQGATGTPKVDFTAQLIERTTQKIVWSSLSYNAGDDGVYFFDRGRLNTAHAMASRMVSAVEGRMGEK
jgi:TolB-like protein